MTSGARYMTYALRTLLRPREVPVHPQPVTPPQPSTGREHKATLATQLADLREAMLRAGRAIRDDLQPHPAGYPSSSRPVEELSAPPASLSVPDPAVQLPDVLDEVRRELLTQDTRFGEQNHPNGTGSLADQRVAEDARHDCDLATAIGTLTWRHVLLEEVFEAFAEEDPELLREELLQAAAVALNWARAIDRADAAQ